MNGVPDTGGCAGNFQVLPSGVWLVHSCIQDLDVNPILWLILYQVHGGFITCMAPHTKGMGVLIRLIMFSVGMEVWSLFNDFSHRPIIHGMWEND